MGELHGAKRVADNFNFEVKRITKKSVSAGFPRILYNLSIRTKMIL